MRTLSLFGLIIIFVVSLFANCTLYGSIARIPHFGITITEYAEKERDVFLIMYIASGSLLPHNARIKDLSLSLARRAHKKVFMPPQESAPISPYATRETFDLAAALIRFLYWITPVSLALFLLLLLMPKAPEEEA